MDALFVFVLLYILLLRSLLCRAIGCFLAPLSPFRIPCLYSPGLAMPRFVGVSAVFFMCASFRIYWSSACMSRWCHSGISVCGASIFPHVSSVMCMIAGIRFSCVVWNCAAIHSARHVISSFLFTVSALPSFLMACVDLFGFCEFSALALGRSSFCSVCAPCIILRLYHGRCIPHRCPRFIISHPPRFLYVGRCRGFFYSDFHGYVVLLLVSFCADCFRAVNFRIMDIPTFAFGPPRPVV